MKGDMVIETPIKFFIVIVAAVLIITFLRNVYQQAGEGVEDLVPDKDKEGYEVVELGDASSGQIASMVDSCGDVGSKQPGLKQEFGCFIVRGNFANINPSQVESLSKYNVSLEISSGANALFIDYYFPNQEVRVRS